MCFHINWATRSTIAAQGISKTQKLQWSCWWRQFSSQESRVCFSACSSHVFVLASLHLHCCIPLPSWILQTWSTSAGTMMNRSWWHLSIHTTGWMAFGFSPHGVWHCDRRCLPKQQHVLLCKLKRLPLHAPLQKVMLQVYWLESVWAQLAKGKCQRPFENLSWHGLWQSRRSQIFCRSCVMPASPRQLPEIPYGIPDGTRWCYLGK